MFGFLILNRSIAFPTSQYAPIDIANIDFCWPASSFPMNFTYVSNAVLAIVYPREPTICLVAIEPTHIIFPEGLILGISILLNSCIMPKLNHKILFSSWNESIDSDMPNPPPIL